MNPLSPRQILNRRRFLGVNALALSAGAIALLGG